VQLAEGKGGKLQLWSLTEIAACLVRLGLSGGQYCCQHDWALVGGGEAKNLALSPLAVYSQPPGFPGTVAPGAE